MNRLHMPTLRAVCSGQLTYEEQRARDYRAAVHIAARGSLSLPLYPSFSIWLSLSLSFSLCQSIGLSLCDQMCMCRLPTQRCLCE